MYGDDGGSVEETETNRIEENDRVLTLVEGCISIFYFKLNTHFHSSISMSI